MKAIRRKKAIFAVLTGLGVIISMIVFTCSIFVPEIPTRMFLLISVPASGWMAGLWLREHRRSEVAELIIENQILHIRPAIIRAEPGDEAGQEAEANVDIFISYFGILLGAKIIKFNQDGISLKAVEIGPDFISLTYGREKRVQNMRLLRDRINNGELEKTVERFRYETGIVPVIIN